MPRTLVIGRSPFADVVVADASVAPHHLELVITEDGRLHVTDCATASGSWRLRRKQDQDGGNEASEWVRIRQAFVAPYMPLRLGDYACTLAELLASTRPAASDGNAGDPDGSSPRQPSRSAGALGGRVERDAATGEIVRRRP